MIVARGDVAAGGGLDRGDPWLVVEGGELAGLGALAAHVLEQTARRVVQLEDGYAHRFQRRDLHLGLGLELPLISLSIELRQIDQLPLVLDLGLDLIHHHAQAEHGGYYQAVAEPLMRTMVGRPTLLQRFPDGAAGKSSAL